MPLLVVGAWRDWRWVGEAPPDSLIAPIALALGALRALLVGEPLDKVGVHFCSSARPGRVQSKEP